MAVAGGSGLLIESLTLIHDGRRDRQTLSQSTHGGASSRVLDPSGTADHPQQSGLNLTFRGYTPIWRVDVVKTLDLLNGSLLLGWGLPRLPHLSS
jgi:hypothetical protein